MSKTLRQPEVAKMLLDQSAEPVGITPDQFARMFAAELQHGPSSPPAPASSLSKPHPYPQRPADKPR